MSIYKMGLGSSGTSKMSGNSKGANYSAGKSMSRVSNGNKVGKSAGNSAKKTRSDVDDKGAKC